MLNGFVYNGAARCAFEKDEVMVYLNLKAGMAFRKS